jgi:selenide, water dikinase
VRRLTTYAAGGGCACKLAAPELRRLVHSARGDQPPGLLVGADTADDAAVISIDGATALVSTADFFTPVVDDPRTWGRIAAANALSDVYAMGGRPVLAINLLAWPVDDLPLEVAAEVLRGGADVTAGAGIPIGGGHTITAPEPLYGMAVTGVADPARLIRVDRAEAGLPLTLTKPIGTGVLNARHKATGEVNEAAVSTMTELNASASEAALAAGIVAGTDVTGFGLLGHLMSMLRASGVGAVVDVAAVPVLEGARQALEDGHCPGGSRRNLDWVRSSLAVGDGVSESDLLILADAQTSGGLLLVGEIPGGTVIGETTAAVDGEPLIRLR